VNQPKSETVSDFSAMSSELAKAGHLNKNGKPYAAESVASMLR
jgi:hypothetical protein